MAKVIGIDLGTVIGSAVPRAGSMGDGLKLLLIWFLALFASAVSSQLIARVARARGPRA